MTGNPDGLRSLAKHSKVPVERIDYRAEADASVIGYIERGILFLMAFWSVPSLTAFTKLTEVVARLDECADANSASRYHKTPFDTTGSIPGRSGVVRYGNGQPYSL